MAVFFVGGSFPLLTFDASLREDHTIENTITDNPIETGGIVTDHVQTQPRVFPLEVVQSLTPDSLLGLASGAFAGVPPSLTRHIDTWNRLKTAAELRLPFTVITSLEIFTNVVIERLSTVRTADTTNALIFSMVLRTIEIAIVDEAANIAAPAVDSALGEQDLGTQGTQSITDTIAAETVGVNLGP